MDDGAPEVVALEEHGDLAVGERLERAVAAVLEQLQVGVAERLVAVDGGVRAEHLDHRRRGARPQPGLLVVDRRAGGGEQRQSTLHRRRLAHRHTTVELERDDVGQSIP